jgi:UDP-N-acetylglucosamine 2-epimerase
MKKEFIIITLLGIRPDIIRMFKIIEQLDKGQKEHEYKHILCHTGQHF